MAEPLFHVIRVNDRTGQRFLMTAYPEPHATASILLSKVSTWPQFPYLRTIMEPAQ